MVFCTKCGKYNDNGDKFCYNCGKGLKNIDNGENIKSNSKNVSNSNISLNSHIIEEKGWQTPIFNGTGLRRALEIFNLGVLETQRFSGKRNEISHAAKLKVLTASRIGILGGLVISFIAALNGVDIESMIRYFAGGFISWFIIGLVPAFVLNKLTYLN